MQQNHTASGRPPGWLGCANEVRALGREIAVLKSSGTVFGDRRAADLAGELKVHADRLDSLLNATKTAA